MQIYQAQYIRLDKEIREKLIKDFNIQKSQVCEIKDNTLISDGVSNEDLQVVTQETMMEYLGITEALPWGYLWELTLTKIDKELHPELHKDELPIMGGILKIESMVDAIKASEEKRPYCGACVSHHGKHSKNCITNNTIKE